MLNNTQIFYSHPQEVADGFNVVLIHGAGGSHLDWPATLLRLPRTTVYGIDLPGHGRSGGPGRASVGAYADDVQNFMETMYLEKVVLVGHSMGGAIAQMLALRDLPDLAALVLIGTGARLRVNDAILESVRSDPGPAIDFIIANALGPEIPGELRVRARERLEDNDPHIIYGDYVACNSFDVMDRVKRIGVPTLVISGSEDKMTPPKYGRYMADQVRDSRFIELAGAGHYVQLEKPNEVGRAVTEFLETLR